MSNQEQVIEVAGKKVVLRYAEDGCPKCMFYPDCPNEAFMVCAKFDKRGLDMHESAYFVEAEQPKKTNALFEECVKNCDPKVRAEVRSNIDKIIAEETHSLREWAQILATNPELRAEFDKLCPPQPIQGSIAPQADLEAEIERWWNDRYAKLKKDYKFDSTSGHYIDNEGIIDLARHFAEWERGRIEKAIRLAWGKISMNPFDVDSAFEELLSKVK